MPKVYNKHLRDVPYGAVYVGRPSVFGNPFVVGKDGTREQVIKFYETWVHDQPRLIDHIKKTLKGKDLVCFCAPLPCHADVLLKIAND